MTFFRLVVGFTVARSENDGPLWAQERRSWPGPYRGIPPIGCSCRGLPPRLRVSRAMKDAVHDDLRADHLEEHCVRKPTEQRAAYPPVNEWVAFGMPLNRSDGSVENPKERLPEADALLFIPHMSSIDVGLGLRGKPKRHRRRSNFARTSFQGFAAAGLRWCARFRLASSFR